MNNEFRVIDVEAEYKRLHKNMLELYNLHVLSITSGPIAAEKLRKWRRLQIAKQVGAE